MHQRNWLLLIFFFFICNGSVVMAESVDATFPVEAGVFAAIQLTVEQDMSFGRHNVVTSNTDIASTQPAKILASADANAAVTGSFGDAVVPLACQSSSCIGSPSIAVDTFICSAPGFNADCTGIMGSTAEATININAVMHLTPENRVGTYAGTQTFSLVYS